jgi:ADP-ribose pyrophosphatase YjhB (NUDIX family)
MKVIAGCVVEKDNKILMVQEGLDFCYGQWNYPAGHVDEFENITDAAIREVKEETGLDVKLVGLLPICETKLKNETHVIIRFVAEVIGGEINFDSKEIIDVKWIDIDTIKNMTEKELRNYEVGKNIIKDYVEKKIYPIDIFSDKQFF